jgi:hypothetical protein
MFADVYDLESVIHHSTTKGVQLDPPIRRYDFDLEAMNQQTRGLPPRAWSNFFILDEFDPADRRSKLISDMLPFLSSEAAWPWLKSKILIVGAAGDELALSLNIPEFSAACNVAELVDAVTMQPSEAIPCLSIAFYEVLSSLVCATWRKKYSRWMFQC